MGKVKMAGHANGPRARTRARSPRPAERPRASGTSQSPFISAAQLLLGVGLSCLGGAIMLGGLVGVVLLFLYLSK
jgi:hypothetical protein